jgi:hypothetical protein
MRRVICWVKGHDWEKVSADWPMVIPGAGVMMRYSPDPNGKYRACRRCRTIDRPADVLENP